MSKLFEQNLGLVGSKGGKEGTTAPKGSPCGREPSSAKGDL